MSLSIVMPTYNGMRYLKQAVDSVLSQSYQGWELIISDDGSKDGTRDYLLSLEDPRVKVHFQTENLGIFGNLNFLLSQARYEITQILCQDDYLVDSGALDRLLSEWSRLPDAVTFLRSNHRLDVRSRLERYQAAVLPPVIAPEHSDLLFFVFGCIPGNLSNVSVRTSAVEGAGWFRTDLPYAGDFEFWSRLGRSSPWALSRFSVTCVRQHIAQASVTLNLKGEKISQLGTVLDILYRRLVAEGHSPLALRFMAAVAYISQEKHRGVKDQLSGRGRQYLACVAKGLDPSSFSFGSTLDWGIYFASLGGHLFTVSAARQLLKAHNRILSAGKESSACIAPMWGGSE